MLYDEYLTQSELQRWILDADVAWSDVDAALARTQPALLDQVREAALIESYFPIYTTRLVRAFWDQVDVTAVFSVQLYESYKHFYALNRYLEIIDYKAVTEQEIVDARRRTGDLAVADPIAELARYMISEHFAAYFFMRLSRQAAEPMLQRLAGFIAKDEFRHTQFAFDLLDVRVREQPALRDRIVRAGLEFHHVGADVVDVVPISEKNDLGAILSLNKKIRRLCGVSLADAAREAIESS